MLVLHVVLVVILHYTGNSQLAIARQVGLVTLDTVFGVLIGAYQSTLLLLDLKSSCVLF